MTEYKRIFLDTAPIIYFLDESSPLRAKTEQVLSEMIGTHAELVTSVISCMEYLVHPYRRQDSRAICALWQFVDGCGIQVLDVTKATAEKAAKIRAVFPSFKAMDALQLAVARMSGCDVFLTNDKQLRRFDEISFCLIEEREQHVGRKI